MEGLARRSRPGERLDESLLPRVGQGDSSALEALYIQTERAMYALACLYCGTQRRPGM